MIQTVSSRRRKAKRPQPPKSKVAKATAPPRTDRRRIARLQPVEQMAAVRKGLAFREVKQLQADLDLPLEALGERLGIARATLHRRQIAGRLTSEESEKVVRFARVFRHAKETLGGGEEARAWLSTPQVGLGGAVPLEYVRTELGVREVENLLGRIEHGVYA